MPQIPTSLDLGKVRIDGSARPAAINPNVALDIGRAGRAWDHAFSEIADGFAKLGAKRQAMDDATWLSDAKIKTLEADDAIRRDTELNAGEDGTGYEAAPARLKSSIEEVEKRPGGSDEARQKYKLWAAEQGYETGRWAANAAQGRLKQSTLGKLDSRLDTLQGLASANPDRAEDYLKAYEEEVNGYVGSAISATDAKSRIDGARSSIGKASLITRAIKNPSDFGKALKAIEGVGRSDTVDTETRGPNARQPAIGVQEGTLSFIRKEEGFTASAKWDYAQHSIGYGTKARSPGERISRAEAEKRLREETQKVSDFIDKKITVPLTSQQRTALISFGFNLGTDDIEKISSDINAGNFDRAADRMLSFNKAGGERNQGLVNRRKREAEMMRNAAGAEPVAASRQPSIDVDALPKIDGTIQPAEILKLAPEDRAAVVRELGPHLQVEMQDRMNRAIAAIGSKGSQDIITPEEIDNAAPLIGVKNAAKWKEALGEAKIVHDVGEEARSMTLAERRARTRELVPTGNPDDLAGDERLRFDVWQKVNAGITKAIKADPLHYLSQENESGRQAMKIFAGADPGATGTPARERALNTLIELQRREGVASSEIRVLFPDQADEITKRLRDSKPGPAAEGYMNQLRQTYGKHFDQIWGELVDHGAPPSYLALHTATRQGQDDLIQSYALERSMSENKETKKDMLLERAGAKRTELQQAITNEITPFLQGLDHKGSSLRVMEGYRIATERLALYYMTQGKGVTDAISSAAQELYGKNVEVYRNVIIPREVNERIGSEVQRTLSAQGSQFKSLIAPFEDKLLSNARSSGGLYPQGYDRQRFLDSVRSSPRFVTNENASGVYVLDEHNQYVLYDLPEDNRGPRPLMFTWEQLAKAPLPSVYQRFPGAN